MICSLTGRAPDNPGHFYVSIAQLEERPVEARSAQVRFLVGTRAATTYKVASLAIKHEEMYASIRQGQRG